MMVLYLVWSKNLKQGICGKVVKGKTKANELKMKYKKKYGGRWNVCKYEPTL
jgi:hypothetical protein